MEKKIIVSRRFRKNTLDLFEYLINEFSEKIAFNFLEKLEQRIELISRYPEIGKPSPLRANVRSVILEPYSRIFYRLKLSTVNFYIYSI